MCNRVACTLAAKLLDRYLQLDRAFRVLKHVGKRVDVQISGSEAIRLLCASAYGLRSYSTTVGGDSAVCVNSTRFSELAKMYHANEPISRLYASIMVRRLVKYTEQEQLRSSTQTGYRPQLGTVHPAFALQHVNDKHRHANSAPLPLLCGSEVSL